MDTLVFPFGYIGRLASIRQLGIYALPSAAHRPFSDAGPSLLDAPKPLIRGLRREVQTDTHEKR
jgi:hypothetical protein